MRKEEASENIIGDSIDDQQVSSEIADIKTSEQPAADEKLGSEDKL